MNWILLATPVAGVLLFLIGLAVARRLMPLRYVEYTSEEKAQNAVFDVGVSLASRVVDAIRGERRHVVQAAAIREMKIRVSDQDAVESEIRAKHRELASR